MLRPTRLLVALGGAGLAAATVLGAAVPAHAQTRPSTPHDGSPIALTGGNGFTVTVPAATAGKTGGTSYVITDLATRQTETYAAPAGEYLSNPVLSYGGLRVLFDYKTVDSTGYPTGGGVDYVDLENPSTVTAIATDTATTSYSGAVFDPSESYVYMVRVAADANSNLTGAVVRVNPANTDTAPVDTGVRTTGPISVLDPSYSSDGSTDVIDYAVTTLYANDTGCDLFSHDTSSSAADTCLLTDETLRDVTGVPATGGTMFVSALGNAGQFLPMSVDYQADAAGRDDVSEVGSTDALKAVEPLMLPVTRTVSSGGLVLVPGSVQQIDPTSYLYEKILEKTDGTVVGAQAYSVDTGTGQHRAPVIATAGDGVGVVGVGYAPTVRANEYEPLAAPYRLLDTRKGTGARQGAVSQGSPIDVDVTGGGASGVPANATAVVLNVAATGATGPVFVQAYPTPASGSKAPNVSNLNIGKGQTSAVAATVAVGSDGKVRFGVGGASSQLIADVTGYYVDEGTNDDGNGSTFHALATPTRAFDTRTGKGVDQGPLGAGDSVDYTPPTSLVPADATAVVLNLGGIAGGGATYLTARPGGTSGRPATSTLNLAAGETRSNLTTVTIGSDGSIDVYNAAGSTNAFADVVGYYEPGTGGAYYEPIDPLRIADTRSGLLTTGAVSGPIGTKGSTDFLTGGVITTSAGKVDLSSGSITAVVVGLTAVTPSAPTYLSAFATPSDGTSAQPTFSSLNAGKGATVANEAVVATGQVEQGRIYNAAGSANAIADLAGYFTTSLNEG